jgi:hypothetical protein
MASRGMSPEALAAMRAANPLVQAARGQQA